MLGAHIPCAPRLPRRAALAAVLCAMAPMLLAQDRAAVGTQIENPTLVITRTVNPRIAYRGVPLEANPIHTQATLFPARPFHGALDGIMGLLVGDDALGQHGSVGVVAGAAVDLALSDGLVSPTRSGTGLFGPGASAAPLRPGASIGGATGAAMRSATAGLGNVMTNGTMQAILPSQQGGGP